MVNHLLLAGCMYCQHSIPDISGMGELHIPSILCLFCPRFFLGWKALLVFSPISLLPACSWELVACSADRWLRWPRQTTLLPRNVGGSPFFLFSCFLVFFLSCCLFVFFSLLLRTGGYVGLYKLPCSLATWVVPLDNPQFKYRRLWSHCGV